METHTIPREHRRLLPTFDRVEPVATSHSAMDDYKKCPRLYFYRWVLGYTVREDPPYFAFGSAYHKFQEVLNKQHKEKGDYKDPTLFRTAVEAACNLFRKKLPKGPPSGKWGHLDLVFLVKGAKVAYDLWMQERQEGRVKVLEVELPWNLTYAGGHVTNGRYDQVIEWNGGLYVRDFKTSLQKKEWFERGVEPNDQAVRYIYSLQKLSGQPVRGVRFDVLHTEAPPAKNPGREPGTYSVLSTRTGSQIEQWEREQEFLHAQIDASREYDVYPMHEPSCNFCSFHLVCRAPNKMAMESVLKQNYKFQPYDNMKEE